MVVTLKSNRRVASAALPDGGEVAGRVGSGSAHATVHTARICARSPHDIAFLLLPDLAVLPVAAAIEVIRAANQLNGSIVYKWEILTDDGAPVTSSASLPFKPSASLRDAHVYDTVIICGGVRAHRYSNNAVLSWLRRQARQGARIGAFSDGAFVLARAGLLTGRRCTIHWNCLDSFVAMHPDLDVRDSLFEIDGKVFTCSGGAASLDLMLEIVGLDWGRHLAMQVVEHCVYGRPRAAEQEQRLSIPARVGAFSPHLADAVSEMESHLEEPISRDNIARRIGISPRQLQRVFREATGLTPGGYYRELRLKRAHHLLTHDSMPIIQVAVACGFASPSHFARRVRERFGKTPREIRHGARP